MSNVHFIEGEFIPSNRPYLNEVNNSSILSNINSLVTKVNALETQFQKAVSALKQRETFVNDMAADLDHIMNIVIHKIGTDKRIEPIF
jgi:hypothetical protein